MTFKLLTTPSASEDVIVRVMGLAAKAEVVDSEKVTTGGRSVIVLVAEGLFVVEPELSVAVT